jgi:hypothetical protein
MFRYFYDVFCINKERKKNHCKELLEAQETKEKEPKHLVLAHGAGSIAHNATCSVIALRFWRKAPHHHQFEVFPSDFGAQRKEAGAIFHSFKGYIIFTKKKATFDNKLISDQAKFLVWKQIKTKLVMNYFSLYLCIKHHKNT